MTEYLSELLWVQGLIESPANFAGEDGYSFPVSTPFGAILEAQPVYLVQRLFQCSFTLFFLTVNCFSFFLSYVIGATR